MIMGAGGGDELLFFPRTKKPAEAGFSGLVGEDSFRWSLAFEPSQTFPVAGL